MKSLLAYSLIFLFVVSIATHGQDLEKISNTKDAVKINGSLAFSQIFYYMAGTASRRPPYNYFLNGNLNAQIYGISVPVSYTLSNQQSQFRQPFNQFGIQPSYKWVKTYIGYNSMTFSPYSLGGHIFLGAGVELTPPNLLRFAAMYGRLQKAVEEDTTVANNVASFQRIGYGLKAGIGKGADFIDLVMFKAFDNEKSLKKIPSSDELSPSENLVLGVNASKVLHPRLKITAEYATSAFTRNRLSEESSSGNKGIFAITNPIFTAKSTTSYYNAFKTNLTYQVPTFSVGVGYERIDPGYRTLGAYFFNNDLENITLNSSKKLLGSKLNISANIGTQRNNLNSQKISTMRRFISSFNINYIPSAKLSLAASYSNFQTYTRIRTQYEKLNQLTPFENLDTLNFVQVTQSASLNSNYLLSKTSNTNKHSLNILFTYQVAGENSLNKAVESGTSMYNSNTGYSYTITPKQISFTGAFNFNYNKLAGQNSVLLGPNCSVSKSALANKLRLVFSLAWNSQVQEQLPNNSIVSFRNTSTYKLHKKHTLNLYCTLIHKNSKQTNIPSFTELTATLGYNYNF